MPKIVKKLSEYIAEAITKNYLITIAVTSYTQAKYQSANLPFGLGKTTLVMELAYILCGGKWKDIMTGNTDPRIWAKVYALMKYNPYSMGELLEPGRERLNCGIWDDVQATAPASQSVPLAIRELANFISTERPECACIFFTCPNLSYIAAPLRKLVNFEIIISERGFYEVHKISYHKDFKHPLEDLMSFDYVDEIPHDDPFPPLPKEVQEWYDNWRIARKQELYPNMMKNLKTYTQLRQWEKSGETTSLTLSGHAIKGPHGKVYLEVPDEMKGKLIEGIVTVNG